MPRRSTSRAKLLGRSLGRTGPAGLGAAGRWVGSWVTPAGPGWEPPVLGSLISDPLVRGRGGQADVAAAPAGDQLDDLRDAAVLGHHLGGDPAQVQRRDAVG